MDALKLFDLSGKNAIIFGGAGGLGQLVAEAFAQCGAQVAIASNGVKWEPQAAFGDTATFKVPRNAFHPGLNTVVLTSLSDEDMQIVDADIDLILHP